MSKLSSRKYCQGDEQQIIAIYNDITGRARTVSQHLWEWRYAYTDPISAWVIVNKEDQVIAHHGLMPIELDDAKGNTLFAGKTENTIIDKKYRGTGIYFLYEKRFLVEADKTFDLLFTTSGHGSPGKIRKRLGYQPVANYVCYINLFNTLHSKKFAENLLAHFIKSANLRKCLAFSAIIPWSGFAFYKKLRNIKVNKSLTFQRIDKFDNQRKEFDDFHQRNKAKFGITIARTAEYLQWRIFDNPYVNYDVIIVKKADKLVGYSITKVKKELNAVVLEDIVVEENDNTLFNSLIKNIEQFYSKKSISVLVFPTLKGESTLSKLIKQTGFVSFDKILYRFSKVANAFLPPKDAEFLVKSCKTDAEPAYLYSAKNWYFTSLFMEGIS